MTENFQNLLGEFVKEAKLDSVASAIVDFDGKELAYVIHGTFDKEFNSQRAASVFAMVVNFLNKTLGGIHFEEDEVEDIVITSKNGYFILRVIETEKCFMGVAVGKEEDVGSILKLIEKYEPLFLKNL
jgi:predicted regulator of Ras-like GTPase activity (Roadblock/LC7/MglB family)